MDTWGIPSGTFVGIYAGALAVTSGVVYGMRSWILGSSDSDGLGALGGPQVSPYDAAMLTGGDKLVLTTAVCCLSESGSVGPAGDGKTLAVTGDLPARSSEVERWVYSVVAGRGSNGETVLDDDAARPVLAPIRDRLTGLGLLLGSGQARKLRALLALFLPAAVLGVARMIDGSNNHKPIGFLLLLFIAGAFAAWHLTSPPLATRAGARALRRLRIDHSSFAAYGFAADVALTGVAALWVADATLATAIGLRQGAGGRGFGSCGGGGGCGGGGCGGCGG